MKTQIFKVDGMSCQHCVKTITNSLQSVMGVSKVDVSLSEKKVTVSFEESKVSPQVLKERIVQEGYEVA